MHTKMIQKKLKVLFPKQNFYVYLYQRAIYYYILSEMNCEQSNQSLLLSAMDLMKKQDFCVEDKNQWEAEDMDKKLALINDWEATSVSFHGNKIQTLLKQITHINFLSLHTLRVGMNHLGSLEVLPRIRIPNLVELHLNNNGLRALACFRKAELLKLEKLIIFQNKICDGYRYSEFPSPVFKYISNEWSDDCEQMCDIRVLAKIKSNVFEQLRIENPSRMRQRKAEGKLERRWKGLKFHH